MTSDELPPKARAILDAASDTCDPTAADRTRIDNVFSATLSSHGVMLALGSSAKGAGITAASGKSVSLGAKLGLTLAATGALLVTVAQIPGGHSAAPSPQAIAAKTHPVSSSKAAVLTTTVPSAPPADEPSPPPAATEPRSEPSAAKASVRSARSRPAARDEHASSLPSAVAPQSPQDALQAELGLIEAATDALRLGRYAYALRLLDEHSARYASGALREERLGLRVLALCGAGDTRHGRLERQRFLTGAPHSVLAEKVRGACLPSTNGKDAVLGDR